MVGLSDLFVLWWYPALTKIIIAFIGILVEVPHAVRTLVGHKFLSLFLIGFVFEFL